MVIFALYLVKLLHEVLIVGVVLVGVDAAWREEY